MTVSPALRRPRTIAAAIVAVAGVIVAVAAVRGWFSGDHEDPPVATCYNEAQTEPAERRVVRVHDGEDPLTSCEHLWTDGTFSDEGVPPLAACVTDEGRTTVIPGPVDGCTQIGLLPRPAEPGEADLAVELADAVAQALEGCPDREASIEGVQAVLAARDLTEWTVEQTVPFDNENTCGRVGNFDAARRVISIVPVPPESTG